MILLNHVKPHQVRWIYGRRKAQEKQERQELMDSLRWEPKQRVGLQCILDCWYLVGWIFQDVDSVDVSSLMLMEEDS